MLEISLHDLLLLGSSLILEKLTGWKYLVNCILHLLLLQRLVHVMIKSMVKGLVVSSGLHIDQEGLIQSKFGFGVQVIIESVQAIRYFSILAFAFGKTSCCHVLGLSLLEPLLPQ